MSHDRFERDLRSVLASMAPDDAPASLHAAVADLPVIAAHEWRRSLPDLFRRRGSSLERLASGALAALAIVMVVVLGSLVVLYALNAPTDLGPGGGSKAISWQTDVASLEADSIAIEAGGQSFSASTDRLSVRSDPGGASHRTLEISWRENGVEMRLNLYFEADATHWWVSELRTYDGRPRGEWITYQGPLFRTERGGSHTGDVELIGRNGRGPGRLHIEGLRLTAFAPGTGPRPFEGCRFVGPTDEQAQDGNTPEEVFDALAEHGIRLGMPSSEAHSALRQRGICHDFRYSWWYGPPVEGQPRQGYTQRWCVPPPGAIDNAAWGMEGEAVLFVQDPEPRAFDPFPQQLVGCS